MHSVEGVGAKRERTRAEEAEQLRQQQGSCFTGVGSLLQWMLHTRDARDALLQLPLRAVLHHLEVLLHHIPPGGEPGLRHCRLPRTSNGPLVLVPRPSAVPHALPRHPYAPYLLLGTYLAIKFPPLPSPYQVFFTFLIASWKHTNQLNYPHCVTLHSNNWCET
jgi:hypothetical protein